jgi:hypothetical protein
MARKLPRDDAPIAFVACLATDNNRNALVRKATGECYLTLEVSLLESPQLWARFDELLERAFLVTITDDGA